MDGAWQLSEEMENIFTWKAGMIFHRFLESLQEFSVQLFTMGTYQALFHSKHCGLREQTQTCI